MTDLDLKSQFTVWLCEQRYLPYRLRKSIAKRIAPKILSDYPFEINFFGFKYRGNTSDNTDYLFFMYGACERYILSMMEDIYNRTAEPEGFVYVDVGAHVGNHVLFMSKLASRVYAFEPHPVIRNRLEQHVQTNEIKNIHIFPYGLSNENALKPFYAPKEGQHLSGSSFCEDHSNINEFIENIEVKKGDDVLNAQSVERVDIIKIDVEGFEKYALQGLKQTLARFRPIVVAELSETSRKTIGSHADLCSLFPENYGFFQFSGVHREKTHYHVTDYHFEAHDYHLDVIAFPKEKEALFKEKYVERFTKNKCIGG